MCGLTKFPEIMKDKNTGDCKSLNSISTSIDLFNHLKNADSSLKHNKTPYNFSKTEETNIIRGEYEFAKVIKPQTISNDHSTLYNQELKLQPLINKGMSILPHPVPNPSQIILESRNLGSKSEEVKNEQSFLIGQGRQVSKAFVKKSLNFDLKDDEEWTYTPPKFYNVKESSVSALDSYKYITIYKHNKKTNRTVRYFL